MTTTKIYKNNQTVIPSEIRQKFNIKKNDLMDWKITKDNKIEIEIIKPLSLKDMVGRYTTDESFDAVKDIRRMRIGDYK
ncbi:AbrB/MazE/SpoVT family DNA-binding domain-containing protein [Methanobrevibacter curvatus]|uniref:SpoVT-AbrB domain-containing protein n=1 Tax=Methanobrevibacter curvatus TaxID=49547 RepID=A0A166B330_9EURY|nr:AbrB/MazE/SpoVT family DNA-binding domain-containing protein [Methanobrevibacter curvatus]KZX12808.1 hypothetical protein MBCUR_08640 [Methanobrevibacter curvatus]